MFKHVYIQISNVLSSSFFMHHRCKKSEAHTVLIYVFFYFFCSLPRSLGRDFQAILVKLVKLFNSWHSTCFQVIHEESNDNIFMIIRPHFDPVLFIFTPESMTSRIIFQYFFLVFEITVLIFLAIFPINLTNCNVFNFFLKFLPISYETKKS